MEKKYDFLLIFLLFLFFCCNKAHSINGLVCALFCMSAVDGQAVTHQSWSDHITCPTVQHLPEPSPAGRRHKQSFYPGEAPLKKP